jgi:hypothetical protein
MPACVPASPAVVIVWKPSMTDSGRSGIGIGIGSRRMGAIGTSTSYAGAVRHSPMSAFRNGPQWPTVGRIR